METMTAGGGARDSSLELRNIKFKGEALAGVWRGMVTGIDGHETDAKWADPPAEAKVTYSDASIEGLGGTALPPDDGPSEGWVARHCRQGQHFSQVVKCGALEARPAYREEHGEMGCKEPRPNLLGVLPSRFLPTPDPVGMVGGCLKVDRKKASFAAYFSAYTFRAN